MNTSTDNITTRIFPNHPHGRCSIDYQITNHGYLANPATRYQVGNLFFKNLTEARSWIIKHDPYLSNMDIESLYTTVYVTNASGGCRRTWKIKTDKKTTKSRNQLASKIKINVVGTPGTTDYQIEIFDKRTQSPIFKTSDLEFVDQFLKNAQSGKIEI